MESVNSTNKKFCLLVQSLGESDRIRLLLFGLLLEVLYLSCHQSNIRWPGHSHATNYTCLQQHSTENSNSERVLKMAASGIYYAITPGAYSAVSNCSGVSVPFRDLAPLLNVL